MLTITRVLSVDTAQYTNLSRALKDAGRACRDVQGQVDASARSVRAAWTDRNSISAYDSIRQTAANLGRVATELEAKVSAVEDAGRRLQSSKTYLQSKLDGIKAFPVTVAEDGTVTATAPHRSRWRGAALPELQAGEVDEGATSELKRVLRNIEQDDTQAAYRIGTFNARISNVAGGMHIGNRSGRSQDYAFDHDQRWDPDTDDQRAAQEADDRVQNPGILFPQGLTGGALGAVDELVKHKGVLGVSKVLGRAVLPLVAIQTYSGLRRAAAYDDPYLAADTLLNLVPPIGIATGIAAGFGNTRSLSKTVVESLDPRRGSWF